MLPAIARQHALERREAAIHHPEIGHIRHALVFCRLHFADRRKYGDHGVVDPDIDRPESRFHRGRSVFDGIGVRNIRLQDERRAPCRFTPRRPRQGPFYRAREARSARHA